MIFPRFIVGLLVLALSGCASSDALLLGTDRAEIERTNLGEPTWIAGSFRCMQKQEATYEITEYHGTKGGYGPEAVLGLVLLGAAITFLIIYPEGWIYAGSVMSVGTYLLVPRQGESWTKKHTETRSEIVERDLADCGR